MESPTVSQLKGHAQEMTVHVLHFACPETSCEGQMAPMRRACSCLDLLPESWTHCLSCKQCWWKLVQWRNQVSS